MSSLRLMSLTGSVLVSFGAVFAVCLAVSAAQGPVAARYNAHVAKVDADLRFIKAGLTGRQTVVLQLATCVVLTTTSVLSGNWFWMSLVPVAILVPQGFVARKRMLRVVQLDGQVDAWLVILANALRATPALGEALSSSARLVPAPLSDELALVMREYQLGAPLDVALRTMAVRLQSRTVNVALGTLRIARTTGGNLPDVLETSAAALREIARLEGVVRTKTAEGKAQSVVVAAMPFPLIALLNYLNPDLLAPLWNTGKGYGLLLLAFLLWLGAVFWARKILAVDI